MGLNGISPTPAIPNGSYAPRPRGRVVLILHSTLLPLKGFYSTSFFPHAGFGGGEVYAIALPPKGSFRDGRSTSRANETGLGPDSGLAAILCRLSERPVWAVRQAEKEGRSATVVETETTATANTHVTTE